MPKQAKGTVSEIAGRFGRRLRYPQLFVFVLALFLIDLVIPDAIPFADEILFGLLTVLLGSLGRRDDTGPPAEPGERTEKDVTPRGS